MSITKILPTQHITAMLTALRARLTALRASGFFTIEKSPESVIVTHKGGNEVLRALKKPAKHTPTPKFSLHQGDDYLEIQHPEMVHLHMRFPNVHDRKLTAFLVKAVNSHAKLLEALEKIAEPDIGEEKISWRTHALEARDIARAAIADAEGEE